MSALTAREARLLSSFACRVRHGSERLPGLLLEQGDDTRQDFIQEIEWESFDFLPMPCCQVEHAWLIASDDPCRLRTGECDREAKSPGEIATRRDRQDDGELRSPIELGWGNNQHRTVSLLLVSRCWIEGDAVDIAAIHSGSRPTASASSHSRSSAEGGME